MDVQEIIGWLTEDDWFTNVTLVSEAEEKLVFNATDEDGNKAEVMFEVKDDKIIVSAKTENDDRWLIVDIIVPE